MRLSEADRAALVTLEESLWRTATRFDHDHLERTLAPDFFEYGRSGRVWSRGACMAVPAHEIDAVLPLPHLQVRLLDVDTAQLTYDSAVTYNGVQEHAHRSSIWSRTPAGWVLRFHQGTPFTP